jgi:hypothetical protein
MKKMQKKDSRPNNGVLSTINDKPEKKVKVSPSEKKKGVLSKINDKPEQKEVRVHPAFTYG